MSKTPETDAAKVMISTHRCNERFMVPVEVSTKLELERDRWKKAYYAKEAYNDCLRAELNKLRRQLKELQP